jgi:hypothetical protein
LVVICMVLLLPVRILPQRAGPQLGVNALELDFGAGDGNRTRNQQLGRL